MKYVFVTLLGALCFTGCSTTPNYLVRGASSTYLCRAIADGNSSTTLYREVLDERKHSCQDGLAIDDKGKPLDSFGKQESSKVALRSPVGSVDERAKALNESFVELLGKAQAGKSTYLKSAREHRDNFFRLYPEHKNNLHVNEYLSYMAMLAEQVDLKKMTESQVQYELAKKSRELFEEAQKAAQQRQLEFDTARTQQTQAKAEVEQAALIQKQQDRQELKANLLAVGLQILQWNHEMALATQMRQQQCVWNKQGIWWYQTCN